MTDMEPGGIVRFGSPVIRTDSGEMVTVKPVKSGPRVTWGLHPSDRKW
jgi:hypothetical protein